MVVVNMKIDNLLKVINEIKEKALEQGVKLEGYTLWTDEITFEEPFNGYASPIFATYYCNDDKVEYK